MAVFVPAGGAGGRSSEYKGGWTGLLIAGILTSMICGWAYGESAGVLCQLLNCGAGACLTSSCSLR